MSFSQICAALVAASNAFPQGLGRFFVPQSQVDELKADEGLVPQVRDAIEPVAVAPVAVPTGPCPNPAYQTTIQPPSGEILCVNEWSINEQGCTVGPSGEMVCPHGNRGAGGDSVTFGGNKGHRGTGSNGNAGPVGGDGLPVDPAAVTYLKQIEEYQKWAEREAARG